MTDLSWTRDVVKRIEASIEALHDTPGAFWTRNLEAEYEAAKELSDFIGMILRLAFTAGAAHYFFTRLDAQGPLFIGLVFADCFVICALFYLALCLKIYSLIFAYLVANVLAQLSLSHPGTKLGLMGLALFKTSVIHFGIYCLVTDLTFK
jgi:hypothetical protein